MKNKNITDMNDFFSVEYIREKLIKKFREQGKTEKEIKEVIAICDKEYKENKIPYPDLD